MGWCRHQAAASAAESIVRGASPVVAVAVVIIVSEDAIEVVITAAGREATSHWHWWFWVAIGLLLLIVPTIVIGKTIIIISRCSCGLGDMILYFHDVIL